MCLTQHKRAMLYADEDTSLLSLFSVCLCVLKFLFEQLKCDQLIFSMDELVLHAASQTKQQYTPVLLSCPYHMCHECQ